MNCFELWTTNVTPKLYFQINTLIDCFDTECDVVGEDSTVLVDEFYNTDCGVTDDDKEVIEELD